MDQVFVITKTGVRFNRLSLGKGLNPRIAMSAEKDPNGNLQLPVELVGKRQRESGKPSCLLHLFPSLLRSCFFLRIEGRDRIDIDLPDWNLLLCPGEVTGKIATHAFPGGPDHVRLSGREPHFTNQHSLKIMRLPSVVPHPEDPLGERCFEGVQPEHPVPFIISLGSLDLPRKLNRHFASRDIGPPDRHCALSLQDHVVGKGCCELNLLCSDRGTGQGEK